MSATGMKIISHRTYGRWQEKYPKVRYIFPKEIKLSDNYLTKNGINPKVKEQIYHMKANTSLELEGLRIETLPSTDEGVAFLAEHDGHVLYHAGDLNNWRWNGESKAWNNNMNANYHRELENIRQCGMIPEAAMLPLDGRQEEWFYLGLHEFMETVGAKMVFPMHFWRKYDMFQQLTNRKESEPYRDSIMTIKEEGQSWEL